MALQGKTYQLIDVIEASADITDKSYGTQHIGRFDIENKGAGDIVVTLGSLSDKTIPAGVSWGYYVDIKSFSLVSNGNQYSIDIGV